MARNHMYWLAAVLVLGSAFWRVALSPADSASSGHTPEFTYRIVNTYPHDPEAFTQGLEMADGVFYEGTGRFGQSSLRRVDPVSGRVLKIQRLQDNLFGEGITLWGDRIIQLTWRSGTGLVHDRKTFEILKEFYYPGEGWGLTHDDRHLIMSDGTAFLRELDPVTFREVRRFEVTDQGVPVSNLNELEYVNGRIMANIWTRDRIAIIDPGTGQVTGWLDLAGLKHRLNPGGPVDVLNGIAYDGKTGRLFVTGKLWPRIFEIEMIPK